LINNLREAGVSEFENPVNLNERWWFFFSLTGFGGLVSANTNLASG
jgi:hypothetical protein